MGKLKDSGGVRLKIAFNAPVVLSFTVLCVLALGLNYLTKGASNLLVFSVYRSSLTNPLTWVRFIGHVFGHSGPEHLINNMMTLLILGPMLEEKYGSVTLIETMVTTALVTGVAHFILFPGTALLGASGIVFAFILLASFTGFKEHEIPLTFILVAVLYLGEQVYDGIFTADNISQLTHILGGLTGAVIGYGLNRRSN